MKMIHCADLHLDSRLNTRLDAQKARARRTELIGSFLGMIEYARREGVSAILIAGDLFDKNRVSAQARNSVLEAVKQNPSIGFYYLRGNHDTEDFWEGEKPDNLFLFGGDWTSYELGGDGGASLVISGVELSDQNSVSVYDSLRLRAEDINLVMLHGQVSDYASRDRAEVIDLGSLKNQGIDYLALGHIHSYRREILPPKGVWCYSGCLEGRGFDELGEHGFVLLEIDFQTRKIKDSFVPFARRRMLEVPVDVTGTLSSMQMAERMLEALRRSGCGRDDLVRVTLTGELDVAGEKSTEQLRQAIESSYYYSEIRDETRWRVDYLAYARDASLKGEFIRMIQGGEGMTEQEKAEIIRCGIQVLQGEELEA